jgi:large subunit ribosomal protein L21
MKEAPRASQSVDQYAIFKAGGKQYQAVPGKTVAIEKLEGNAGDKVSFAEVLFRKTDAETCEFGRPYIKGATIQASIVKQDKGPKVIVFKFQRRKKRRTKTGHRQSMTIVRIESI